MFLISVTWIHSQEISDTDSTNVAYNRLAEFAKFVAYKDSVLPIFDSYETELQLKDSIIGVRGEKLKVYEFNIVPALELINIKSEQQSLKKDGLLDISKFELRKQRRKKFIWLGFGTAVGIIISTLLGK